MKPTHGKYYSHRKTYACWQGMKQRCYNKNCCNYNSYGGRGIIVCDRWMHSFENFLADMGKKPEGMSIDRINNDGNYEPSNCRWTTVKVQQSNRRKCHHITHDGITLTVECWGERIGRHPTTIHSRLKAGWSIPEALSPDLKHSGSIPHHETKGNKG